jgi:hypothetical protein
VIDSVIQVGDNEFSRLEFLTAFQTFRQRAFTTSTILSTFQATGVEPWDPQKVLNKIHETSTTPPPSDQPYRYGFHPDVTPKKAKDIAAAGDIIGAALARRNNPTPLEQWTMKFIKGSLLRNTNAVLIEELLDRTQLAEDAKEKRKLAGRKVIQKGGVMKVSEARRRIQWREGYTLDFIRKRMKKIPAAFKKRYQKVMEELESCMADLQ